MLAFSAASEPLGMPSLDSSEQRVREIGGAGKNGGGRVLERAVFDLSDRTRLVFSGADRLRYLNGQLTQDLKKLVLGRALPGCVTSAKGRLQADVWVSIVVRAGGVDVSGGSSVAAVEGPDHPGAALVGAAAAQEGIIVDAAPELREALAERLERYIVADDVVLEDMTGREALLHCIGFDAEDASGKAVSGVLTSEPLPEMLREFPRIVSARLGEDGWDVVVPLDRIEAVKQALVGSLGTQADWERVRILRGIPAWGAELDENTLPPEAGLERTHIDYHKGCYIGQEVISRLKSVGHVNRTLHRFLGRSAGPETMPKRGTPFSTEGGEEAGVLTSVAPTGDAEFLALGYLRRGREAERFVTAEGAQLERLKG
jgi:folate-binding protein YgfZ